MEEKMKKWIKENAIVLAWGCIAVLGVLIRTSFRDYLSADAKTYLIPWYYEIKNGGGIKSLSHQVGNYNLIYQFFIALFTYCPFNPLTIYKMFSCVFDVALAILGGIYTKNIWKNGKWKEYMTFVCIFVSPIVMFNSSLWGQCDSIYTFFCIATIYLLFKERFWMAMMALGIAFSFKLQTIFILPFIIVYYIINEKFKTKHICGTFFSIFVLALPGCVSGRSLLDVLSVYKGQVTEDSVRFFYNYPGFSSLFLNQRDLGEFTKYVKSLSILMTIIILGCIAVWIIYSKIPMSKYNFTYLAFLMTYATVLFLPAMHERYGYLYEIMAILIAMYDVKTIVGCLAIQLCSVITYSYYLFGYQYDNRILSLINFSIFIIYLIYFMYKLLLTS